MFTRLGFPGPGTPLPANIVRQTRTSAVPLTAADSTSLIDITSGTFTQTFSAAAELGSGWYCYIRNSGTGDITLDPNGAELIDGLATYIMYPGETRLVQCTGTAFTSVVITSFVRTASSTFTFTKPPGYQALSVEIWGGGGGGGSGSKAAASFTCGGSGGGGGSKVMATLLSSAIGTTETVTIAATANGGAAQTTNGTAGVNGDVGGNSTFGSWLTAYGGWGGYGGITSTGVFGGPGAGTNSTAAGTVAGGQPIDGPAGGARSFGGGDGGAIANVGKQSVYGGGGGGAPIGTASGDGKAGGGSLYAGGGGGGGGTYATSNGGSGGGPTTSAVSGGGGGAGGVYNTTTPPPDQTVLGMGGGGGYTSFAGPIASKGGNGGPASGGGGGGAGKDNLLDSYPGGTGGTGYCIIKGVG